MKISVGIKVEGYTEYTITDRELLEATSSEVLVYLDKDSNDRLIDYYKAIRNILRQSNKLVLLYMQDDETEVTKAVTHLCLEYACYNIYKLIDVNTVTKEYVDGLFKRESSQDEVQMFVSTEGEAYETISEALLRITEYVLDNKLDDLQDYIMQNKDLIRAYPSVLSYMKQNIDEVNMGIGLKVKDLEKMIQRLTEDKKEVEEERNSLQTNLMNLETVVRQREEESEKINHRLSAYDASIEKLKKEKGELEEQVKMLESSSKSASGGASMAFMDYTPMKLTEQRGNKVKIVLYVKEVTRPKYINTFMTQLFSYMQEKHTITKGKVKMVIYDDRSDFGILYNPLIQVNTNTYFEQKANVLNAPIVVFTDTNPAYIRDIATHSKAEYLIVYDRLGKSKDILFGEAIIKFYTFASKKELANYKQKFADLDESRVIMNPSGVLNTLEIDELDGFSGNLSPAAQFAKYYRMLANKNTAATLFTTIVTKCGLPAR